MGTSNAVSTPSEALHVQGIDGRDGDQPIAYQSVYRWSYWGCQHQGKKTIVGGMGESGQGPSESIRERLGLFLWRERTHVFCPPLPSIGHGGINFELLLSTRRDHLPSSVAWNDLPISYTSPLTFTHIKFGFCSTSWSPFASNLTFSFMNYFDYYFIGFNDSSTIWEQIMIAICREVKCFLQGPTFRNWLPKSKEGGCFSCCITGLVLCSNFNLSFALTYTFRYTRTYTFKKSPKHYVLRISVLVLSWTIYSLISFPHRGNTGP